MFLNLPNDILICILQFLSPVELALLSLACRPLYDLVRPTLPLAIKYTTSIVSATNMAGLPIYARIQGLLKAFLMPERTGQRASASNMTTSQMKPGTAILSSLGHYLTLGRARVLRFLSLRQTALLSPRGPISIPSYLVHHQTIQIPRHPFPSRRHSRYQANIRILKISPA